ncbi:unnamed protein product, partial [Amoebophrya sp. A25]
ETRERVFRAYCVLVRLRDERNRWSLLHHLTVCARKNTLDPSSKLHKASHAWLKYGSKHHRTT